MRGRHPDRALHCDSTRRTSRRRERTMADDSSTAATATVPAPSPVPVAEGEPLLKVDGLVKHFPIKKGLLQRQVGAVQAVDGLTFDVRQGETLGVVGESGCGKS